VEYITAYDIVTTEFFTICALQKTVDAVDKFLTAVNKYKQPTGCNNKVVNNSNKMQQMRFYYSQWLTLHVSGDNLTHHQAYISCIWPPVSWLT